MQIKATTSKLDYVAVATLSITLQFTAPFLKHSILMRWGVMSRDFRLLIMYGVRMVEQMQ